MAEYSVSTLTPRGPAPAPTPPSAPVPPLAAATAPRGRPRSRRSPRRRSPRRRSSLWAGAAYVVLGGVALGVITGMGIAKEVYLMVDGEPITLRTFAGTVGEALAAADVRYDGADHVAPPPSTPVHDDGRIVVRHARPLTLIKDGRRYVRQVTALNVGDALKELDLDRRRARLSTSVMRQIPVSGFRLSVTTVRKVVVVRDGRRARVVTTARTVRQVLAQRGIVLAEGERVRPRPAAFPRDGQVIRVLPAAPPRTEPITAAVARLNWRALADCETRSDPRAYNPAGPYYGMYQISLPMWQAVGGVRTPADWPAEEQTYRAQLLYQRVEGRWRRQWPGCGARLFG